VFREYYGGYHTGEDWWGPRRSDSLGLPVYSIGHGMVTYAAPRGWGADKGTVVVRHVFPDGSTILSFYGHLDPPSVVLSAGDCVARGEQIGRIGKPTSLPHLHFEIRTHTPNAPGPGYWPSDPALAGWEPPSQYIWDYRLGASPGVQWMRPFAIWSTRGLGMVDHDTFVAIEDNQLVGISVLDGSLRWGRTSSIRVKNAIIAPNQSVIYTVSHYTGRVEAFRITDSQDSNTAATPDSPLVPMWETRLDASGSVTLMPLPGGGVVVSFRQKMFGVSAAGELLWEHNSTAQAFDWVLFDDRLIFSMIGEGGAMWMADESGPVAWATTASCEASRRGGHLGIVGDQVLVYGENGVYWLNPETLSADLLYALPKSYIDRGDMVALPDGGVLLTHVDALDRRLIALNPDGTLRWQRSCSYFTREHDEQRLLVQDGHPYLVSHHRAGASNEISIFAIDLDRAALTWIFTASGRNHRPEDCWAFGIGGDRLLLNVGNGSMIALDMQLALEAVLQATNSQ
jgi:outer membrane protein assembly factor BamB